MYSCFTCTFFDVAIEVLHNLRILFFSVAVADISAGNSIAWYNRVFQKSILLSRTFGVLQVICLNQNLKQSQNFALHYSRN